MDIGIIDQPYYFRFWYSFILNVSAAYFYKVYSWDARGSVNFLLSARGLGKD